MAPRRVARTAVFLDPESSVHSAVANESSHRTVAIWEYFWQCMQLRQLAARYRCREQQRPQGMEGEQADVGETTIVPNGVPEWPGSQGVWRNVIEGRAAFIHLASQHTPSHTLLPSLYSTTDSS